MLRPRAYLAASSLFLLAGSAYGSAITFTDVVNPPDFMLHSIRRSCTFTHDINDNGFNPVTDTLISGTLILDMRDEDPNDPAEFVNVNLDGVSYGSFDVDFTDFVFNINVAPIQSDGKLVVTLTRQSGDFWFRSSTLKVTAERQLPPEGGTSPVPEPASILLLGLGLGAASFRRLALRRQKSA